MGIEDEGGVVGRVGGFLLVEEGAGEGEGGWTHAIGDHENEVALGEGSCGMVIVWRVGRGIVGGGFGVFVEDGKDNDQGCRDEGPGKEPDFSVAIPAGGGLGR